MTTHHPYSPSALYRRYLCPGSAKLERAAGPGKETPASISGTKVHKAFETGDTSQLDTDEHQCLLLWNKFVRRIAENRRVDREVFLQLDDGVDIVTNGWADAVILNRDDDEVIVADLKTGWLPLDPQAVGFQLQAYCAMAIQKYGVFRARGYALQPRVRLDPWTIEVDRSQVNSVIFAIRQIQGRAFEVKPHPSACTYCRALAHCPGQEAASLALEEITTRELTPDRLNELYRLAKLVEPRIAQVKEYLRQAIEDGVPGLDYEVREVRGRRQCDPLTAFDECVSATGEGYDPDETMAFLESGAVSISVRKMLEAYPNFREDRLTRGQPTQRIVEREKRDEG